MARFMALVTLPEFATRDQAEAFARREYSRTLVRVISVADFEVAEEEHRAIRDRRRRARDDADG